jgi:pimeloyl-ACP methyl ester carboxylesterase
MIVLYIFILTLITLTHQQNVVIYPIYGTFTNSSPYSDPVYRPTAALPLNPNVINTRFYLYTRRNPNNAVQITTSSQSVNFIPNGKIILYIHGFNTNSSTNLVTVFKNAVLNYEDTNFVAVDWTGGSFGVYEQGIANVQIVGIDVALLINSYVDKNLVQSTGVHVIGHSLGAQAASFTGKRVSNKIGRITGLDPAGRQFDGMSTEVRLDSSDAAFVDVIHSNAGGAGIVATSGHVDFWPSIK